MVKFAQVEAGQVVQLGRFYKEMSKHSNKQALVVEKQVAKIGKNVYTAILVQVGPRERVLVALHNIKEVLA